jgi:hypothetical protein
MDLLGACIFRLAKSWHFLPLYGIFVVHRFLRYLFHIQIRNSIELEKNILQYIVVHYFKREWYIASANLTNLGLSKIVGCVPDGEIWREVDFFGCVEAICKHWLNLFYGIW